MKQNTTQRSAAQEDLLEVHHKRIEISACQLHEFWRAFLQVWRWKWSQDVDANEEAVVDMLYTNAGYVMVLCVLLCMVLLCIYTIDIV